MTEDARRRKDSDRGTDGRTAGERLAALRRLAPARPHVAGRGRGRPWSADAARPYPPGAPVRNWSGAVRFTPGRVALPGTEEEVAALLAEVAARGGRVRAIGAGHSFTPLVETDDVLLSLDRLSGVVAVDGHEVTLLGGTRLRDVAGVLAPHGLALANMGDVDPQSIAGAVQTATHGTGLAFTGYPGMVTGLRLALPDGRLVDVDVAQRPDLFEAARVGLGACGIVTRVRLRCVPRFVLAATETTEPVDAVLAEFVDRARATDHLEFFWFPGTPRATVKENRRLPGDADLRPLTRRDRLVGQEFLGNVVFGAVDAAAARLPVLAPAVRTIASHAMAGPAHTDHSHRVFVSPRRVRFQESEYAMPLAAFGDVVREVERAIVRSGEQVTFPLEVRVSAGDDTWTGTASGRDSVYVAVHRHHREDFDALLRVVEPVFAAHDGRPHWGKRHSLDAARFTALYPRFGDFQRVQADVDPSGVLLNDHLRRVLGRHA